MADVQSIKKELVTFLENAAAIAKRIETKEELTDNFQNLINGLEGMNRRASKVKY